MFVVQQSFCSVAKCFITNDLIVMIDLRTEKEKRAQEIGFEGTVEGQGMGHAKPHYKQYMQKGQAGKQQVSNLLNIYLLCSGFHVQLQKENYCWC